MDPVTTVRSQVPQPASPLPPALDRLTSAPAATSAPPVTQTMRRDAVQHPAGTTASLPSMLLERDESDHPAVEAREAAAAARKAYIKASIAAGISPLPLP